jgi:UDP:flavonoid glycosyltransferase YjiC (YdhE family)
MLDDPALTAAARRVADAFARYPAPQRMAAFLEGVRAFHRFAPAHAADEHMTMQDGDPTRKLSGMNS